jgi:hypothetical protein
LTNLTEQRLHTYWQKKALTKLMGLQYTVQYKQGINNGAADALSRKPPTSSQIFVMTTLQPSWLQSVKDSYGQDEYAQQLLQKFTANSQALPDFSLSNGILRYKNRIWVGAVPELQQQLISALHDSPQGGHSDFPVTYRQIASLFCWKKMKSMVRNFVKSCHVCQHAKPEHLKPAGILQPLPIPSQPWECPTMDFIDGFLTSRQFNCLLVIVDKFTKYAHFIPLRHPYTASKVAELFVDHIYRLHGLPPSLVSDRDPVFTSVFWRSVFRATGTKLKMSTDTSQTYL